MSTVLSIYTRHFLYASLAKISTTDTFFRFRACSALFSNFEIGHHVRTRAQLMSWSHVLSACAPLFPHPSACALLFPHPSAFPAPLCLRSAFPAPLRLCSAFSHTLPLALRYFLALLRTISTLRNTWADGGNQVLVEGVVKRGGAAGALPSLDPELLFSGALSLRGAVLWTVCPHNDRGARRRSLTSCYEYRT